VNVHDNVIRLNIIEVQQLKSLTLIWVGSATTPALSAMAEMGKVEEEIRVAATVDQFREGGSLSYESTRSAAISSGVARPGWVRIAERKERLCRWHKQYQSRERSGVTTLDGSHRRHGERVSCVRGMSLILQ